MPHSSTTATECAQLDSAPSNLCMARNNADGARHSKVDRSFQTGFAQDDSLICLHIAQQCLCGSACHLHHCCSRQQQAISHLQPIRQNASLAAVGSAPLAMLLHNFDHCWEKRMRS